MKERRAEELLCLRVSGWRESRRPCVEVSEEGALKIFGGKAEEVVSKC